MDYEGRTISQAGIERVYILRKEDEKGLIGREDSTELTRVDIDSSTVTGEE